MFYATSIIVQPYRLDHAIPVLRTFPRTISEAEEWYKGSAVYTISSEANFSTAKLQALFVNFSWGIYAAFGRPGVTGIISHFLVKIIIPLIQTISLRNYHACDSMCVRVSVTMSFLSFIWLVWMRSLYHSTHNKHD